MKSLNLPRNLYLLGFILFALLTMASCASRRTVAVEEGWEMLAERKVDFVSDKDEIDVTSKNQYTALKFRVEEHDVKINELKVIFDNGDKMEPSTELFVAAGQESKVIDLPQVRNISKIEFKYRTTGNVFAGRANILIFGKRYIPENK